jgi:hypothetical protein
MTPGMNKMRRTVFTIHVDQKVGVSNAKGKHPSSDGAIKFSSERELGKLAAHWPGTRFVEIWNRLPCVKNLTKFTDRKTAIHRIWAALQQLEPLNAEPVAGGPDGGTKTDQIVALLKGPAGASLRAIIDLTGWQSHSVRGFISAQLGKRMGFRIQSFKRDGERIYRIRS